MTSRASLAAVASVAGVALVGALSGCSQVASLVPVSGVQEATVRIAAIDVLARDRVGVLVAPVCTSQADAISCAGTTVAKEPIVVTSAAKAPYAMTVTVAGRQIYAGTAQDVIDAAGQGTP